MGLITSGVGTQTGEGKWGRGDRGWEGMWLNSLDPRGDEGHTDHHQVQDVEVIATERALVKEGSIRCHLQREGGATQSE